MVINASHYIQSTLQKPHFHVNSTAPKKEKTLAAQQQLHIRITIAPSIHIQFFSARSNVRDCNSILWKTFASANILEYYSLPGSLAFSLSLSCFPCSCRLLCFPWLHVNFTAANSFKCCMFFVRSVDVCMPFSLRCFTALTNNIPFLFHQFCSQTQANLPRFKKFRLITYCVLFLSLFHHLHIFPR